MEISEKMAVLVEGAKYDVACTSSGTDRAGEKGKLGNAESCGICHSFSADGRCISLLKILQTNSCIYDCQYCINRRSNDIKRAAFTPEELADITINFYRRNYIEGLFLSSGVIRNPDYTMEQMCETIALLRNKYGFRGYIHAKAIPGSSPELIYKMGLLADRMSVNLELPSEESLNILAPDKPRHNILKPMGYIKNQIAESKNDLVLYKHAPSFAGAGQSTQMIIGATPDTDYQIVRLAESLYKKYTLKRVFYSAYIPMGTHALLPQNTPPPLLREHRLYQADWLLRFYGFSSEEIISEKYPDLDLRIDPKCSWAVRHLEFFPVEVNTADRETLLRVPGIGTTGVYKILKARKYRRLDFDALKKLNLVLKRAAYFITCDGKYLKGLRFDPEFIYRNLVLDTARTRGGIPDFSAPEQLSLFEAQSLLLPQAGY